MKYKHLLKVLLALLILVAIIYKVGVNDIWGQLSQLTLGSVVFLLYISLVLIAISAVKWKLFLQQFAESVSTFKLIALYMVGYFVNLILPSYVGGDAVRSWHIGKKVGQHQALAATVLERYTGITAMLSMAFVFMWFLKNITLEIEVLIISMTLGFLSITFVVLSPFFIKLLHRSKLPKKIISHFERIKEALNFAGSNKLLFLKALVLSYLYHSIAVVNVIAAAYAVGWKDVPYFNLFIILPIVLLIGSLPVTPSGLGLQEGAYFYFLQSLGATSGEATAVALVLRAKSYVLALIGGVFWFFIRKESQVQISQSAS